MATPHSITSYAPQHLASFMQLRGTSDSPVHCWFTLSALILSRWTKQRAPISYSEASWLGLLDFKHLCWDPQALQAAHIELSSLPPLLDYDQFNSTLSDEYLNRWPELHQAKLFLGIGDGAAAAMYTVLLPYPSLSQ